MRFLPILVLGLVALLSSTSLAQNAVPIRLASADNIEDLFFPRATPSSVNVVSLERQAFVLVNKKREENGLRDLEWSDKLEAVARLHSDNMAEYRFFSHKGLDNKYVSDRADAAHVGAWRSIGENIATMRGYSDPVAMAVELWLDSPSHRHNMMDPNWKESAIGVGVAEDGSIYFTQVFLTRK
ncbi:MAG: CAP domain-containing protein [Pyrinomonadaceae bacterium]